MRIARKVILALALPVAALGVGLRHHTQSAEASSSNSTTTPRPSITTTTTTVPLVQTMTKPPLHDSALDQRMAHLFYGLRDYNNDEADLAFLPMRYYVVLKQGGGNEADWKNRLIGHYHAQLAQLRAQFRGVLPGSTYRGYVIKSSTAHTVRVGAEENKAPYWQVFMTTMAFRDRSGKSHTFTINTSISFRGAWYVVHVIGYG